MAKFIVTGGAGFIGSHTVELLLSKNHSVTVYDNFATGRMENLEPFIERISLARGDIRDTQTMREAFSDADYVIHHAAEISTAKSMEDPAYTNDVNTAGTLNVLVCARDAGVKRVVFSSSSAVYGNAGSGPQKESAVPRPVSPYGATKMCGESFCCVFNDAYGLETVRLRYFNVYGPRQDAMSPYSAVIPRFVDRLSRQEELYVNGDGEQTRDFVFVKDVARANYLACFSERAAGEVFNIASGRSVSVNELVQTLMDVSGRRSNVVHRPEMTGEVKHSRSDISKADTLLGFRPQFSLTQGIEEVVHHLA